MRLGRRAIFPLVRSSSSTTTTTSSTSAASSPPAVLSVGHALRERRRFTEADVAAYAAVSGDRNPVHLDAAAARDLGGFHGGRVVHGMLVASLFPSIIAARFPGAVYASQTLKFAAPVYVGDDVVAQVQALHIRATTTANSSTASRYVVKFATKCFADEEEGSLVIEGEAMALLPTLELSSESTSKEKRKSRNRPRPIINSSKMLPQQATSLGCMCIGSLAIVIVIFDFQLNPDFSDIS